MITPASTTVRERVSDQKTEPVLEPGRIGHLALHNRAVVAPMSRVSAAPGGIPTRQMAAYYSTFARGGFALLITEGIYTDRSFAQAYERQPGLVDDAQAAGWEVVTGAVQVPANGRPVVFLADHPTTGGYPVVGVVPAADLAMLAQVRPGTVVRLRPVG